MEDTEGGHHDQNVQAAADEALRGDQPDDQSWFGSAGESPKTCGEHPPKALWLGRGEQVDSIFNADASDEGCRDKQGCGPTGEDEPDVGEGSERASEQWPKERAEALDRRRCPVRGN